jgi:hypothetical protein
VRVNTITKATTWIDNEIKLEISFACSYVGSMETEPGQLVFDKHLVILVDHEATLAVTSDLSSIYPTNNRKKLLHSCALVYKN